MNKLALFPSHIITGNNHDAERYIIDALQEIFCEYNCKTCALCIAIVEKNFYGASWLEPENRYTIELIEPVVKKIQLHRNTQEKHFFIFTYADRLTTASANMILKIVEEPPAGFHFLFLTQHKHHVLETIVSRSIQTRITPTEQSTASAHPLFFLATKKSLDYETINQEIKNCSLNETQTYQLLEAIYFFYIQEYKNSVNNNKNLEKILAYLQIILEQPVQPGSSKIIMRDFFINKALWH